MHVSLVHSSGIVYPRPDARDIAMTTPVNFLFVGKIRISHAY
jgi:hypothetical protein